MPNRDSNGGVVLSMIIKIWSLWERTGLKIQNMSHQYMRQHAIITKGEVWTEKRRSPRTKPWATLSLEDEVETGQETGK